jgi:hypothetical protein
MMRKCQFNIFLGIALCIITIGFICCNLEESVYSKKNHLKTSKIKDDLYSEVFFIRSILSEDISRYSEYITDSVNFRKYVYTYSTGEWIYGEMTKDNNILTIYKITGKSPDKQEDKIIFDTTKIASYNISELKREGKFE